MNDERVYIMDMYNRWIYPNDREAKGGEERRGGGREGEGRGGEMEEGKGRGADTYSLLPI